MGKLAFLLTKNLSQRRTSWRTLHYFPSPTTNHWGYQSDWLINEVVVVWNSVTFQSWNSLLNLKSHKVSPPCIPLISCTIESLWQDILDNLWDSSFDNMCQKFTLLLSPTLNEIYSQYSYRFMIFLHKPHPKGKVILLVLQPLSIIP